MTEDDTGDESRDGDGTRDESTVGDDAREKSTAAEDADGAWPVTLQGITESIVTTRGPNDRWNVAALGLRASEGRGKMTRASNGREETNHDPERRADVVVTARTWGRTRTWRNFRERGEGYVQFVCDPVVFVDAALAIREEDEPVLAGADAWVRVDVDRLDSGTDGETEWVDWLLSPGQWAVRRRVVPTFNRGYAAVVEATVAASRLGVESYDSGRLHERIDYFERIARRCGGPDEREAFERLRDLLDSSGTNDS